MNDRLQRGQQLLEEGQVRDELTYHHLICDQIDEAVSFFKGELATTTDPYQASDIHLNLGISHFLFLQDLTTAYTHFTESIKLRPDNIDSIYNR